MCFSLYFSLPLSFFLFFIFTRLFTFKILALDDKSISFYRYLKNCANLRASKSNLFLLTLGGWAVPFLVLLGSLLWLCSAGKLAGCSDGWDGGDGQDIWPLPPLVFPPGFLQGMAVSGQHFKRMKVESTRPIRSSHRNSVFTSLLPLHW